MLRFTALLLASLLVVSTTHAADVNVLSARHYGSDQALWDAFTRSTGIKVNVVEAEHGKVAGDRQPGIAGRAEDPEGGGIAGGMGSGAMPGG